MQWKGGGKFCNLILIGPKYCRKGFMMKPLEKIDNSFFESIKWQLGLGLSRFSWDFPLMLWIQRTLLCMKITCYLPGEIQLYYWKRDRYNLSSMEVLFFSLSNTWRKIEDHSTLFLLFFWTWLWSLEPVSSWKTVFKCIQFKDFFNKFEQIHCFLQNC